MQSTLKRLGGLAHIVCVALLASAACTGTANAASSAASRLKQASQKPATHSKPASSSVPTRLQMSKLRYTGLSSLPQQARKEFHADMRSPAIEAADEAEERCSRGITSNTAGETAPPCLGLYRGEPRSPVKFSFDLSLKSIGAPKDVLIGQCPAGSNFTSCNSVISEAKAEQERLADTLNRQRRYPVATLGVAVSF